MTTEDIRTRDVRPGHALPAFPGINEVWPPLPQTRRAS